MLLTVSCLLIRQPERYTLKSSIDSAGILQLTWLLGRQPSVVEPIAEVENPEIKELLKAGMFEVQLSQAAGAANLEVITPASGQSVAKELSFSA